MRHRLVVVAVVGFWAVMTASLVRRWLLEVKPEFIPGTYRSVLTADRQNYQCRMGIYLPGLKEKAGYTETVFMYSEDGRYRITNITRVQAAVPGLLGRLAAFALDTNVVVGKGHALERFSVTLSSPVMGAEFKGEVVGDELVLRARVEGDEEEEVRRMRLPPGGMVASGLSPLLALPPLRVGLRWTTLVLNPLTLALEEVELVNDVAAVGQVGKVDDLHRRGRVELRHDAGHVVTVAPARIVVVGEDDDLLPRSPRPVGLAGGHCPAGARRGN